jgi:putative SOS response-associated peptidase YedK
MCGSFALGEPTDVLTNVFDVNLVGEHLPPPSWNIRPTQQINIVVDTSTDGTVSRRLESARWSLIPSWVKGEPPKFSTFNARSEDATTKASWKESVVSKRCLVPASGYYEWVEREGKKVPFYIHSEQTLAFAGLCSWWRAQPEDPWMLTATILTMATVSELASIHDRNPVPLPAELWSQWLNPDFRGTQELIDEAVQAAIPVASTLSFHEVAPLRGNGPELIQALT